MVTDEVTLFTCSLSLGILPRGKHSHSSESRVVSHRKTQKGKRRKFTYFPREDDFIIIGTKSKSPHSQSLKNNSECDMIMRMEGIGYAKYRLPIAAKKENTIVIPKGDYLFSSIVCGAQYASQKSVHKAIMVTLGNPK